MRFRLLIALFVIHFGLVPAYAAWTPDELDSLQTLRTAMSETLDILKTECNDVSDVPACRAIIQGFYELTQAAGWLMHVNVNPNDAAGRTFLAPFIACTSDCQDERQPVVNAAFGDLNRAVFELNKASSTPGVSHVIALINDVDRTLAYSSPFPSGYPNQFGPHGDYDQAQSKLWSIVQYGSAAIKGWLNGIEAGTLPNCPDFFFQYAFALEKALVDTWMLSAHIVLPDDTYLLYQTDFTQGFPDDNSIKRALTELALVNGPTVGAGRSVADHLRLAGDEAAQCLQSSNPHIYEFLRRYADSWNHVDRWTGHFTKIE